MEGAVDPARDQAVEDYKKTLLDLREWEAKLKTLRMGIKDAQKEFDITEENIKALQSVGQIIGEVLKQLDEERCEHSIPFGSDCYLFVDTNSSSHRQSLVRSSICRRLPVQSRQVKAETRHPCRSRYDHAYYNADAASRS